MKAKQINLSLVALILCACSLQIKSGGFEYTQPNETNWYCPSKESETSSCCHETHYCDQSLCQNPSSLLPSCQPKPFCAYGYVYYSDYPNTQPVDQDAIINFYTLGPLLNMRLINSDTIIILKSGTYTILYTVIQDTPNSVGLCVNGLVKNSTAPLNVVVQQVPLLLKRFDKITLKNLGPDGTIISYASLLIVKSK